MVLSTYVLKLLKEDETIDYADKPSWLDIILLITFPMTTILSDINK